MEQPSLREDSFWVSPIEVSKGLGEKAAKPIAARRVIYSLSASQVVSVVFPSLRAFEDKLSALEPTQAADLCAHSTPGR